MIDGNDELNGKRTPHILSGDNPFPMKVPGIERSALKRPVTKEQCVDIATRIAYGMCQQLFEVINTKHSNAIDSLNAAHSAAMEKVVTELRGEIAELGAQLHMDDEPNGIRYAEYGRIGHNKMLTAKEVRAEFGEECEVDFPVTPEMQAHIDRHAKASELLKDLNEQPIVAAFPPSVVCRFCDAAAVHDIDHCPHHDSDASV